ncbi:hypothetical protein CLTEP_02250 [Clostridium tepidiprofundi DSM 19306]|uniref:Phage-like element PBSX protein XkdM n=1 Tax=Clostridium tepidiprofundi DSM 19306 TaxID=1121338 RepID=A0A151B7X1_9CLOT|nr:phage tail tube protein [Clostridium tepidiprofundi]KYH35832.1 hypothetical protein CLTEP_02250 [Clostridium tepidiprofundi DSM 19306]
MSQVGNKQFNGKKGKCWINDKRYMNVFNLTVTITNNYEEILDPRDDHYGKVQIPNGYSIEGSLTLRRDGSEIDFLKELADATKNNLIPEISIVAKMERNDGSKAVRYRYDEVTFDSYDLQKFEQDSAVTELELSFKAATFEEI